MFEAPFNKRSQNLVWICGSGWLMRKKLTFSTLDISHPMKDRIAEVAPSSLHLSEVLIMITVATVDFMSGHMINLTI